MNSSTPSLILVLGIALTGMVQIAASEDRAERQLHPGPIPIDVPLFRSVMRSLDLDEVCDVRGIRLGLLGAWARQHGTLQAELDGRYALPANADQQLHDQNTLCLPSDRDPLGVVLRRTDALLRHYAERFPERVDIELYRSVWQRLSLEASKSTAERVGLYFAACALRRSVALQNPLLDFDRVVFVARANDTRDVWSHGGLGDGRHLVTQYYAFASKPGGGVYAVEDFKSSQPRVRNLLANRTIENGPFAGRRIEGGVFLSPELSFDAKRLLFCWAPIRDWQVRWQEDSVWQIYETDVMGGKARQLTSGPFNDFDPCYLPDGRIAFISERRGGYIRCFDALLPNRNYVLHSMKADGSDVLPLSWFETCEWQPSLTHDGRLAYTRWDYIDRDLGQGQNLWTCYPDGRDPRAPHGNYPGPHHVDSEATPTNVRDQRQGRPFVELSIRAVPGSSSYIACAAPQHGLGFGSLVLIDTESAPDDGHMSQIKRLTPYQPFPESEGPAFSDVNPNRWATPWPLDEDFYLCSYLDGIYLLDRFGNPVLICEKELIPNWQRLLWANHRQGDNGFRLLDPIPYKTRPVPPVIPRQTNQGDGASSDGVAATIRIMNVYDTDTPLPEEAKIRWLRIVQHLPKANSQQDDPCFGPGINNSAKMALGIVPVAEDGSVYCEAPVGKLLIFQLLDEKYRAVHSMRSATYVHPGEQLTCIGCHEHGRAPSDQFELPSALQKAPSPLKPDVGGVEPITYFRTVRPVFERTCIPCHEQEGKGPRNMDYALLQPYIWYYFGGDVQDVEQPATGGTRTTPGRFGTLACRMGKALDDEHHRGKIPEEDYRRVTLWLDNNSPQYGASYATDRQEAGELVWPKLDVDPMNPQGIESRWDAAGLRSLNRPAYLSVSDFHRLRGTIRQVGERPDWSVTEDQWDGAPGRPRGWVRDTWRDWSIR